MGCVFKWIIRNGGIEGMTKNSMIKSEMIYDIISQTGGFYSCPVAKSCRSRMNIPFRIGSLQGDDVLEKEFLKTAESNGLIQLKGHRSVGGIRASLYNAITVDETIQLAKFMKVFYDKHQKAIQ